MCTDLPLTAVLLMIAPGVSLSQVMISYRSIVSVYGPVGAPQDTSTPVAVARVTIPAGAAAVFGCAVALSVSDHPDFPSSALSVRTWYSHSQPSRVQVVSKRAALTGVSFQVPEPLIRCRTV